MSVAFMEAFRARDYEAAEREIGATLPRNMADHLDNFFAMRLAQLAVDPDILEWLGRAMVITEPGGVPRTIGSLGFHGPPDEHGRVEVGYRIEPEFRRRGFTIEAVRALFDWAQRRHGITRFRASVSPGNEASLALIGRLGFRQTGTQMDEIDGLELVFDMDRPTY